MLTDEEAEEIERQRRSGVVGGPLVVSWVDRLLADRCERVRQLQYLQHRLRQAFRYLDGLISHPELQPKPGPRKNAGQVLCPLCRKPYLRARGNSPQGIAYDHGNGQQCRTK